MELRVRVGFAVAVCEFMDESSDVGHVFQEEELICTCSHVHSVSGNALEFEELLFKGKEVLGHALFGGTGHRKGQWFEVEVANVEAVSALPSLVHNSAVGWGGSGDEMDWDLALGGFQGSLWDADEFTEFSDSAHSVCHS